LPISWLSTEKTKPKQQMQTIQERNWHTNKKTISVYR